MTRPCDTPSRGESSHTHGDIQSLSRAPTLVARRVRLTPMRVPLAVGFPSFPESDDSFCDLLLMFSPGATGLMPHSAFSPQVTAQLAWWYALRTCRSPACRIRVRLPRVMRCGWCPCVLVGRCVECCRWHQREVLVGTPAHTHATFHAPEIDPFSRQSGSLRTSCYDLRRAKGKEGTRVAGTGLPLSIKFAHPLHKKLECPSKSVPFMRARARVPPSWCACAHEGH